MKHGVYMIPPGGKRAKFVSTWSQPDIVSTNIDRGWKLVAGHHPMVVVIGIVGDSLLRCASGQSYSPKVIIVFGKSFQHDNGRDVYVIDADPKMFRPIAIELGGYAAMISRPVGRDYIRDLLRLKQMSCYCTGVCSTTDIAECACESNVDRQSNRA